LIKKVMNDMGVVMDNLTMEHKEIPVYAKNLYKWTPKPTILKQDVCWDIPVLEDLECPYCSEFGNDLYEDDEMFIYVDPEGYLRFGTPDGIGKIEIQFCPMCGRPLK